MKKLKYKALVSFAGPVSMYRNQERQLSRREAAPLLKAGYIEPVEQPAETAPEQPEETAPEQPEK